MPKWPNISRNKSPKLRIIKYLPMEHHLRLIFISSRLLISIISIVYLCWLANLKYYYFGNYIVVVKSGLCHPHIASEVVIRRSDCHLDHPTTTTTGG